MNPYPNPRIITFSKYHTGIHRFICKAGTTFKQLREELAEKYDLYQQRILLVKTQTMAKKQVFDVNVIGDMPDNG